MGEVSNVARSVWQGLLDWWDPARARQEGLKGLGAGAALPSQDSLTAPPRRASQHAPAPESVPSAPGVISDVRDGWIQRSLSPPRAAEGEPTACDDATEEELLEFLSADYASTQADPEFKRKLREQLWALVQHDEMTRQ